MPSPFPGMDPFIEGQMWRDFHTTILSAIREALMATVAPKYFVKVEESVYLQQEADESEGLRYPDVSVVEGELAEPFQTSYAGTATALLEPKVYTVPKVRIYRQRYLEVIERQSRRVVTVIEFLSPTNKGDGYRDYLAKRAQVLSNPVNLVELDLLRGGRRLPTVEPLELADFYAFVSRHERRPKVEGYGWPLSQALPAIPVPLRTEDPDALLDLQQVFTTVYDRSGYRYSLDYRSVVEPPLDDAKRGWVQQALTDWRDAIAPTITLEKP